MSRLLRWSVLTPSVRPAHYRAVDTDGDPPDELDAKLEVWAREIPNLEPVTEGIVERGSGVRLLRDNVVIHEGKLKTLKRFKDEVKEVPVGQECGMAFENYEDIRQGDVIECFRVESVVRTL